MENSVTVRTPAKINLSLDIVGKRTDGYHYMKTIMQSISIYDMVSVCLKNGNEISIHCTNDKVPLDETNIAIKAVHAFFKYVNMNPIGIEISIEKNIPIQAGLAGGSSNAAGVLVALNELLDKKLSIQQLTEIGLGLGADVPFCIVGGTALAEGIGEILMPLPILSECYIVIAKGTEGISTAEAFKKYDDFTITSHPDNDELIAAIVVGDIERTAKFCKNVLEDIADIPNIEKIKNIMLENGALCSLMTGSGSAVYGIFQKKRHAANCADELEKIINFVEICTPVENGAEII